MPCKHHASPHSVILTFSEGVPEFDPSFYKSVNTYLPSTTSPKTVCLPLSQGQGTKVIKN